MRKHYQTNPNLTIPEAEQFAIALLNPSQIQLFRSWNSLRSHYKPIPNPTIPESQQFA
ncbi:hypothetical protein [Brunnivagina elsteri]|uniref:hypothetical protein n=1 Tax=Brunnivagina elsteri TaxID=1247191 RepID=UPI0013047B4E|nr:hypothetical protein [Calothrix elsteri]